MHFPSIIQLKGGMGNQLFQFCFGQWLKSRYGVRVFYDTRGLDNAQTKRNFELSHFQLYPKNAEYFIETGQTISNIYPVVMGKWHAWKGRIYDEIDFEGSVPANRAVAGIYRGFWQDFRWVREVITQAELFRPVHPIVASNPKANTVGIHIRGTDYLQHPTLISLNRQYYQNAIQLIQEKVSDPEFIVFTDDKAHATSLLGDGSFSFASGKPAIDDFWALSACQHHIIANSTFSWWAAALQGNPSRLSVMPLQWEKGKKNFLQAPGFVAIDPL